MTEQDQNRFDEAFRDWARQPSPTAADAAARQVVARLPEGSRQPWLAGNWLRLASATAGLALMLVVAWATRPGPPDTSSVEVMLPPLQEDVVLLWLDDQTPLYLTVAPPAAEGGSR